MMEDYSFLKLLFVEDIYLLENNTSPQTKHTSPVFQDVIKAPSAQSEAAPKPVTFYGQNKKNILLLLHHNQGDFLKSAEYELMLKILEAAGYTLHEFAAVNIEENKHVRFETIKAQLKPQKVLAFLSQDPYSNAPKYQSTVLQHLPYLPAENLSVLLKEQTHKQALWAAIKKGFLK